MNSFYNHIESFKIISSIMLSMMLYEIPLRLNKYLVPYVSERFYIATIYDNISNFLIRDLGSIVILFYITKKLPDIFRSFGIQYSNLPEHHYTILLFNISYILLGIIYIFISNVIILFITNTLIYSIYLSQLMYLFLDPDRYSFRNNMDFYNSNVYLLNIVGGVYSILDLIFFKQFRVMWFVFFTIVSVPIFLKDPSLTNHKAYINCFYIPERVLSKLLSMCSRTNEPLN